MLAGRTRTIQAASGVIGLFASALVLAPGAAHAERAVSSEKAGTIEVWGATAVDSGVPNRVTYATDGPWTGVALGNGPASFGITQDRSLKRLSGTAPILDVPAGLTQALAVDTVGNKAAAVTPDGSVQVWGDSRGYSPQIFSPAMLGAKAVDVELSSNTMIVLLEDGRVGSLFAPNAPYEITQFDGVDLDNVVQIDTTSERGFARLAGGGVVSWDQAGPVTGFPAEVRGDELADPVADFAVNDLGAAAVTESGDVITWNTGTGELITLPPGAFPTTTVAGKVEKIAASSRYFAAVTSTNKVAVWGKDSDNTDYPLLTTVPEEVEGHQIADIVGGDNTFAAIVTPTEFAVTSTPKIAGTATVGATLTGTPATYSGTPDAVTNRWLADGTPISGATATTYTLTAAELGKNITFESTATRGSDTPIVSVSAAAGPVTPQTVPSTTTASAAASKYGTAGTVTVTVGNAAGRPVGGTVTLSGAGAAQTAIVTGGKATFALDRALAAGSYTLTAAYSGSPTVNASAGSTAFAVAKGSSSKPAFKVNKASTSKKKGKATVTLATGSGLAKASGKATVTLKSGKTTKKINVTLSGGKKSISLPKLKKGTWKVQVSYNGDKNYVAQKSKSYNLKIKK